ncbi:MAG: glycosyltransferase family 4 protein [Nonlabens sp.]
MAIKEKKILILTSEFPPQPGGIGQHALDLAKQLEKRHQVIVIADQRSNDGVEELNFDADLDFKVIRIKRLDKIAFTYAFRLKETLNHLSKVDLVMTSGKFSLWQIHMIKLRFPSKPVIAIIHGSEVLLPSKITKKLTDRALEKADCVVAVSHYTQSLVNHLKIKSMKVIPNGITNIPDYKKNVIDSNEIHLLTVGNLTQRKGQHNVIEALPLILKEFPQVHYHCVGLPTNLEQLQELAEKLQVSEAVTFHGRLSERDKQKFYENSHIFLMLSERTESGDVEGFGIAILEANANGLPAIGSSGSGIEDAIKSGHSGYLVNPHDKNDIVEALRNILKDYPSFEKQSYTWSKSFKWEVLIQDYHQLLKHLCA